MASEKFIPEILSQKENTPQLLTKFDRILLPVYQYAVDNFDGFTIENSDDASPSLMFTGRDASEFWRLQEEIQKIYLVGINALVHSDLDSIAKLTDKLSANDAILMVKALTCATKHLFIFDEPSCLIYSDVEKAFAELSDEALDILFDHVTEGKFQSSKKIIKVIRLDERCHLNVLAAKKAADICKALGLNIYAAEDEEDGKYISVYRRRHVSDDKFWKVYHELV